MSPYRLNRIESGVQSPEAHELDTFAEVTGRPRSYFELPLDGVVGSFIMNRDRRSIPARDRLSIHALARILAAAYQQLHDEVDVEAALELPDSPTSALDSAWLSGTRAERAAAWVRSKWRLGDEPIGNMVGLLEAAGIAVIPLPWSTSMLDALTFQPNASPSVVFIAEDRPPCRLRYSLAHELGHLILHGALDLDDMEREAEADEFAAALLLPEDRMMLELQDLTWDRLKTLKAYWGVSMAALLMRARHLGLTTKNEHSNWFKKLSARGWRTREPVQLAPETPRLSRQIVSVVLGELRQTPSQLSERLGLRLDELLHSLHCEPRSWRMLAGPKRKVRLD